MAQIHKSGDMISIPSSLDFIAAVDEFVEEWLRARSVPEDTIADMAIAVTELVNNAVKHGNRRNEQKKVTIHLRLGNDRAQATISDEGDGFDPRAIPNPVAEENLMKEVGRGIFIARSLMDDVQFDFPAGAGTRVTITKKLP
jgi:serine/threonine-protein kinase RsbW